MNGEFPCALSKKQGERHAESIESKRELLSKKRSSLAAFSRYLSLASFARLPRSPLSIFFTLVAQAPELLLDRLSISQRSFSLPLRALSLPSLAISASQELPSDFRFPPQEFFFQIQ